MEGFKELCLQELGRNASLSASVADEIVALACPNECNTPNGNCTKGKFVAEVRTTDAANEVVYNFRPITMSIDESKVKSKVK